MGEVMFEGYGLVKDKAVDKDAIIKFFDTKIGNNESYWKQPLKDSFDRCQKMITTSSSKIQEIISSEPYGVKKEDCDPQFIVMLFCIHLDSFGVS